MSVWTATRTQYLKDSWADGMSAGLIANRLNCGLSRNAVISKARRLGLPYRAKTTLSYKRSQKSLTAVPKSDREQKLMDSQREKALAEFNAAMTAREETDVEPAERMTILTRDKTGRLVVNDKLTDKCCRWPIGDPGHPDFHFCGRDKVPGSSYCMTHLQRAYRPTPQLPYLPRVSEHGAAWIGIMPGPSALEADPEISDMGAERPPSPSRVLEAPLTH